MRAKTDLALCGATHVTAGVHNCTHMFTERDIFRPRVSHTIARGAGDTMFAAGNRSDASTRRRAATQAAEGERACVCVCVCGFAPSCPHAILPGQYSAFASLSASIAAASLLPSFPITARVFAYNLVLHYSQVRDEAFVTVWLCARGVSFVFAVSAANSFSNLKVAVGILHCCPHCRLIFYPLGHMLEFNSSIDHGSFCVSILLVIH